MKATWFTLRIALGLFVLLPVALRGQTPTPTPIPEAVKQTDRELLEKLETQRHPSPAPHAEQTPKPVEAEVQKTAVTKADTQKTRVSAQNSPKKKSTGTQTTNATTTARKRPETSATPKPETTLISRLLPAVAEYRGPAPVEPRPELGMSRHEMDKLRDRVKDFVELFFDTAEKGDLSRHLALYAPRVDYFGDRGFSQARIAKDTADYNARWPQRSYSMERDPEITMSGNLYVVQFPMKYSVRAGRDVAKGRMFYTMHLKETDAGLKIVSIEEQPRR